MDFDKPKVYGDTFISDGLVFLVVNDGYWILEKTSTSIYVPLGFSCPQKPETLTIGRTYPLNAV